MKVTLEISYYPMTQDFESVVLSYIDDMHRDELEIKVGKLSTVVIGEYQDVMNMLNSAMLKYMESYVSVFNIKLSNYQSNIEV